MCSAQQLGQVMNRLIGDVKKLFDYADMEVILYGSYARQEADEDSDVDVMVLLDMPREKLPAYRRNMAKIAGDMLFDYGVVVSPVLENRTFFERNRETYPFFRNVDREGIRYAS